MKRRWIHIMFGAATLSCTSLAAYHAVCLQHALALNRSIAAAATPPGAQPRDEAGDDAPQAQLARAVALSRAGRYAEAGRRYIALTQATPVDDVGRTALFDLANMYLREAAGDDAQGPVKSLAMIEMAKARYRDLLRVDPQDWDVRYNLERTLRLAPEAPDGADDDKDIEEQHNVTVRGAEPGELP
jgi:mxaK protein